MRTVCLIRWDMSLKGGAEKMTALLANELSAYHNVIVLSLFSENRKIAYEFNRNVEVYCLSACRKPLRYQILYVLFRFIYFMLKKHVEVVFLIDTTVFWLSPILYFMGIKNISCEHSNLKNKDRLNKKYMCLRYLAVKYTDCIVTLTQEDRDAYIDRFNVKSSNICCIYNFIDQMEYENRYNVDSKIIVSVGRFDRIKGYEMLVDVAEMVFREYKDWIWHIYGDGDKKYFKEIKALIKERNLEKNIILMGQTDDVDSVYDNAAMLVLTSYNEGLPMVLLEAKQHHLPIISFMCPTGPAEIVENGISGFLIPCYDKVVMAKKIIYLIENKSSRNKFSMEAVTNLGKFSKEVIITKWLDLLR